MICEICQRQEVSPGSRICINCGELTLSNGHDEKLPINANAVDVGLSRKILPPRKAELANERTKEMAPHYGEGEQHWDRMWKLYREAWFVGNVTKYVERYRKKDGLKDLRKAAHYLQKLIELEEAEAAFADHDPMGTTEGSGDEASGPDRGAESLVQDGAG